MKMFNDFIVVHFHDNSIIKLPGGVELLRPEAWEGKDQEKLEKNYDLKETNPQQATVIIGNENCNLQVGDDVFVHYLAIESATPITIDGEEYSIIPFTKVFFKIKGEHDYEMSDYTYLGEQVFTEGVKTKSGIYITPFAFIKEAQIVKITHVPEVCKKELSGIKVGDVVTTEDDNQYIIKLHGKEYVKLGGEWITGSCHQYESWKKEKT